MRLPLSSRLGPFALTLPLLLATPIAIAEEGSAPPPAEATPAPVDAAPKKAVDETPAKPTTADKLAPSEVATTPRIRSEDVRDKQQFAVGLRTGFMFTLVPGLGVEGDYQLSDSLQLGASVNVGKLNVKDEAEKEAESDDTDGDAVDDKTNLDEADLRAQSIAFHVRFWPLNSLYVTSGLSHRSVSTEMKVSDKDNAANYIKTSTDSKSICFDLGIGNQWNFESGFFIGAEWLGVSAALTSKSNDDTETGGVPTSEVTDVADDNKKLGETLGEATTVRLAMLHLGWAF